MPLAAGGMLVGCNVLDSPTEFIQATPVRMASNGMSVIFKSPGESNNCPLQGGMVSFAAVSRGRDGTVAVRFSYQRSHTVTRNDVVTLATESGTLSISGHKQYSLVPPAASASWRSLQRLGTTPELLFNRAGADLSIMSRRQGGYFVEARDGRHRDVFTGMVRAADGKIYMWDSVFRSLLPSYSGKSEHDCGNWDTAAEATKALGRVEGSIPL